MDDWRLVSTAMEYAIPCVLAGVVLGASCLLVSSQIVRAVLRIDSVLYTTLGGAAIGCVTMCMHTHTIICHAPTGSFIGAGILSGSAAFLAGVIGRFLTAFTERNPYESAIVRWTGNILAFLTAWFVIVPMGLA